MKKPKRPPGVPKDIERQIKEAIRGSHPQVVDPALADKVKERGGKASDLVAVPVGLITRHIGSRKKDGATEEQISEEVAYILGIFEQQCRNLNK
jgi:hypothetical protein